VTDAGRGLGRRWPPRAFALHLYAVARYRHAGRQGWPAVPPWIGRRDHGPLPGGGGGCHGIVHNRVQSAWSPAGSAPPLCALGGRVLGGGRGGAPGEGRGGEGPPGARWGVVRRGVPSGSTETLHRPQTGHRMRPGANQPHARPLLPRRRDPRLVRNLDHTEPIGIGGLQSAGVLRAAVSEVLLTLANLVPRCGRSPGGLRRSGPSARGHAVCSSGV